MNETKLSPMQRVLRNLVALALAGVVFTGVSGCMLLAAGAAGAGAGYIAGEAADDDDDHVVHEREVIIEERHPD